MNKPILLLPLAAFTSSCMQANETQKPNVIIILADDLGFGDVSAYGATTINTPNIDRLAREGVCFNNGYATSATSTPSRYAMMTGMYPWKNPRAKILPGDAPLIISTKQYTLPQMMKENGYATGAIGKWHLGMGQGKVDWNHTVIPGAKEIGFEYSCLVAATNDRVPTVFVENGDVVGLEADDPIEVNYKRNFEGEPTALTNPEILKMKWHHGHNNSIVNGIPRIGFMKGGKNARWIDEDMADYFVGKVKDFVSEHKDEPFFLYYGLHQPHVPRTPNARFVGSTTMGPRGDVIVEADWCVGELIAELEKDGILENTLIIFSSDNGPVLQDGYFDGAETLVGDHDPCGGLRGGKYSLYDAGTHVPMFAYWKGHIKPVVTDAMMCQMDFAASIAKLIGCSLPDGIDSQEHLSTLLGKSRKGRVGLVTEAMGRLAYRQGNRSLIPPYKGSEQNETGNELGNIQDWGLFNLSEDPHQQQNLVNEETEIFKKMKNEFLSLTKGYYKETVIEEKLQ